MEKYKIMTSDLEDLADLYICALRETFLSTDSEREIFIDVLQTNITKFSSRAVYVLKREVKDPDLTKILDLYDTDKYNFTSPWLFSSDQINRLIKLTVKYAVGRRTYVTAQVSNLVKELIEYLDIDTISWIIKHIAEASVRDALGDTCDYESWKSLAESLSIEKETRTNNG